MEKEKALPLPALVATAVGVVVVQSTMITMLNGAGIGRFNFPSRSASRRCSR